MVNNFGYDPDVDNTDQKGFHLNESGSKLQKTLAFAGDEVPVVECHAHTRSRYTVQTYTTTNKDRASGRLPLEIMMKGGDEIKASMQRELEAFRASGEFGDLSWISVTTGPSGSYDTQDVLDHLSRHLPEWSDDRRWRIFLMDDYTCHKDQRVWDLCWSRGYIRVLIGGGLTGAVQFCDTHLHAPVSVKYQHAEMEELVAKEEEDPGAMPTMTREDVIRLVTAVFSDRAMHVAVAERCGVDNYVTSALDGSDDHRGNKKLKELWEELDMPAHRTQILESAKLLRASGIPWSADIVQNFLEPYPLRKECMNSYQEGMDDEGFLFVAARGSHCLRYVHRC